MPNTLNESWNVNPTRRKLYTEIYDALVSLNALQTCDSPYTLDTSSFVLSEDWLMAWVISADVANIKSALESLSNFKTNKHLGDWYKAAKIDGRFKITPTIVTDGENSALILDKGKYLRLYDSSYQVMSSFYGDEVMYAPPHHLSTVLSQPTPPNKAVRNMAIAANTLSCIVGSCPNLRDWVDTSDGQVTINNFIQLNHDTFSALPGFLLHFDCISVTDHLPCLPAYIHEARLVDNGNTFAAMSIDPDLLAIKIVIKKLHRGICLYKLCIPYSILELARPYDFVLLVLHAALCMCGINANYISMFPQDAFSKDIRLGYGNIRDEFLKYRDLVDYIQDLYYK